MTNAPATDDAIQELEIEPAAMRTSGKCACCGKARRTAWGFVYRNGGPRACYFVEWTLGRSDCSARFDVVVGQWFDGTTDRDREAVSLEYHLVDDPPSFSVVDAEGRPAAEIGRATRAAEIDGTPLVAEVLEIAEAVLTVDERLRNFSHRPPLATKAHGSSGPAVR